MLAILLGLSVSMVFGTADFLGGYTSQRANTAAVVLGNQVVGLLPALIYLVLLLDEAQTAPSGIALGLTWSPRRRRFPPQAGSAAVRSWSGRRGDRRSD